jgi:hypothetical protein
MLGLLSLGSWFTSSLDLPKARIESSIMTAWSCASQVMTAFEKIHLMNQDLNQNNFVGIQERRTQRITI